MNTKVTLLHPKTKIKKRFSETVPFHVRRNGSAYCSFVIPRRLSFFRLELQGEVFLKIKGTKIHSLLCCSVICGVWPCCYCLVVVLYTIKVLKSSFSIPEMSQTYFFLSVFSLRYYLVKDKLLLLQCF